MRLALVFSALLFLSSVPSYAQSPESVAAKFFEAIADEDYVLAAGLFDADALAGFRKSLSFLADLDESQRDQAYSGLFGEGATPQSIAALSDAQFFSAFLRISMSQMGGTDIFSDSNMEYLGHVAEDPDIAHLVVRATVDIDGGEYEKMTVVSCREVGGQWKLLMSGEVRGISDRLRSAFGVD